MKFFGGIGTGDSTPIRRLNLQLVKKGNTLIVLEIKLLPTNSIINNYIINSLNKSIRQFLGYKANSRDIIFYFN